MDKVLKVGIGLLAGVALVVVARKLYKSIEKSIDEEKEAQNQEIESLGVSAKKLNEELDSEEDENNMVKSLAVGTMFNPNWDFDFVDPELALDAEDVISVMQEKHVLRGGKEEDSLVFYLDIPEYTKNSYRDLKIGDYVSSYSNAAKIIEQDIVKMCRAWKTIVGLVTVTYQDPDDPEEEKSDRFEIDDPSIYAELSDGKHDGLVSFYENIKNGTLPDSINENLTAWINQKWPTQYENFRVVSVTLAYKISFRIQTENQCGITFKTALEALKYLVEEFKVKKNLNYSSYRISTDNSPKFQYKNIIFCAIGNSGKHELTSYYYIKKGKIAKDSFSF
jgi:hypothetical protein